MRTMLAIVLIPTGMAAAFARPFLTFAYVAMFISYGWAYLNPGWVDAEFSNRILMMALAAFLSQAWKPPEGFRCRVILRVGPRRPCAFEEPVRRLAAGRLASQ